MENQTSITNTMPALERSDVEEWIAKAKRLLECLGLSFPDHFGGVNIYYSDEEKTQEYGLYSIEEIKGKIRQTWKTNDNIEGILAEINDYRDYRHGKYEILAGEISRIEGSDYRGVHAKLDCLFSKIKVSMPILGEYDHEKKGVVFYTSNICKYNLAGRSEKEAFEAVFAHEFFHLFHYAGNDKEIICRYDYASHVVKESLASAFEWHYLMKHDIIGADELKESWDKYPVGSYPYSGAENLITNGWGRMADYLNEDKFLDVLMTSATDMDQACRKLLGQYEYYRFRNSVDDRKW